MRDVKRFEHILGCGAKSRWFAMLARSGLERVAIKWYHWIVRDSLKIKELEHVLLEKVEQHFRDML
jgi:hypothetical protein